MACFPALLAGSTQLTLTSTLASTVPTLVAGAVKEFFTNIFLYPGQNSTAVMVVCGGAIATCVGLAFLIKLVYEKCCPERALHD